MGDRAGELEALFRHSKYADMEALARELLAGAPGNGMYWKALAVALSQQGRHGDALAPIQRAAELMPADSDALSNLANALNELARPAEARDAARRALRLDPVNAAAHVNLGNAFKALAQAQPAERHYREAIALQPGMAIAHNNLGTLLQELGRLEAAEACYREALRLAPGYAEAHNNLGSVLKDSSRIDEAVACFRRAIALRPQLQEGWDNLLFALNYHPDLGAADIFAAYRAWDAQFGEPLRGAWQAHANSRETRRRLRVGYVSPDFRRHSCQYFLEPLLAHHDHDNVEVFAYAELAAEDEATRRYRALVDHWVPTAGLGDDALAQRIRDDGIDVLVDLAGHTRGNRLGAFARKPAPVSVSWLGYGYTTGLAAIDHFLCDAAMAPEGSDGLFAEAPWRVPVPAFTYRPAPGMGEPGELPALRNGFVTFGTLSRSVRLNHRTLAAWAALLGRVPGSRLVVDNTNFRDPAMCARIADRLEALGIARERLSLGHSASPWDVLRGVDIGLDCFPHNSATTVFESLYMGVPFVTLAGRPSVGLLASSILQGAGHPEWIARSEEGYVGLAAALAADLPRLSQTRAALRGRMRASALMDEAAFARKVEVAFRGMFARWAAGPSQDPGNPRAALAWVDRGNALHAAGQTAQAQVCFERALALQPGFAIAHNNLGTALLAQDRVADAESRYRRAIALDPRYADAHVNLGLVLQMQPRVHEAQAAFRSALAIDPTLGDAQRHLLFTLNYDPDLDAAGIFDAYRAWDARSNAPLRAAWRPHTNRRDTRRRLRVGYVSPDFRRHSCTPFLEPLLANHDRDGVELFAYAELAREDAVTARYRRLVDHWVPTLGLGDEALAQRIRDDGIDVLVDLAGQTHGNRLGVFARKPAPVSLTWLGYGATTGVCAIDHFLCDAVMVPPGSEALFAEKPWRVPGPSLAYRPAHGMGEPGELPALRNGFVTFGSLTRAVRLNHRTLDAWSEVLKRVPGSRLVLDNPNFRDAAMAEAMATHFAGRGIEPQRLSIGCHSPPWDVLRGIDIALDCFPHNCGTTVFESLYLGVPFVTLAGRPGAGRLAAGILQGGGFGEWIATSESGFVGLAAALAGDLPRLAATRAGLRARMRASALMDEAGFARKFEAALRGMFEAWARAPQQAAAPAAANTAGLFAQGVRLKEAGRLAEAGERYERVLAAEPGHAEAHNNLGAVRMAQGQPHAALQSFERALELLPGNAVVLCNLGDALNVLDRPAQAQATLRRALEVDPTLAEAHDRLGVSQRLLGNLQAAQACFRRALALRPDFPQAQSNLATTLNEDPDATAAQRLAEARRHGEMLARAAGAPFASWPASRREPLRVGLVSADLHAHPVGYFLETVLSHIDSRRVELVAYANQRAGDALTARIRPAFAAWRDVADLDDGALARQVHADGIGVLVDLSGHTRGHRLGAFARKPAPVQASWLGYNATTGLPQMDYVIGDPWATPPSDAAQFTETLWRLPDSFCCFTPPAGAPAVAPLPAASGRPFTFGCFNSLTKMGDGVVALWARVLHAVPHARLRLDARQLGDARAREQTLARFGAHGIAAQRLVLGTSPGRQALLAAYADVDVALDPFPYPGGTTTVESLWMGVPVIVHAGDRFLSRIGESILRNAGLAGWIARDGESYVALARASAGDLPALAALRARLRGQLQASPLLDAARFAGHLENAWLGMHDDLLANPGAADGAKTA